jgi:hypothetical protein
LSALLATGVAACNKTPPQLPREVALAIPTPPARTLLPVELPPYVEPEPEPVVLEEPEPTPPRAVSGNRSTEKPPAPPPTPPAEPAAAPALRTAANSSLLEQSIVRLLGSAEQRLKAVNFRELSVAGRAHYEQARSFIRMANEQLSIKNYSLAEVLATRANRVAELLGKV